MGEVVRGYHTCNACEAGGKDTMKLTSKGSCKHLPTGSKICRRERRIMKHRSVKMMRRANKEVCRD